jgi:eukaryotic-like serine/threonine-protein kinase
MPAAAGAGDGDPSQDPIKGYELLLKLGAGAMGAVLKAKKRDTGEIVALKILKPELAGDAEYVQRFMREAKAVQRMSHPNIIRAIQSGKSGEYYFFAMEFIEGQTVSDLIKAKGKLPERFGLMVTRSIAAALSHAWQHQIIHRDIKPDNIMVTKDGGVKLTDLGLARTAKQESTLTITGVVMGSPAYISPEQATGEKNLDARSDIYSLGATLFHVLTGKVPYDGETPLHVMLKHMNDPLPDVRKLVPQVSEATRQLIFKMMAKRPEGRFQNAGEVEAAARAIEDALGRGETPSITWGAPQVAPAAASADGQKAAAKKAPVAAAAGKKPPAPKRASVSGEKKLGTSKEGGAKGKDKDLGERLRRMAKKKKRF